jgi:hypothetical protein
LSAGTGLMTAGYGVAARSASAIPTFWARG